MQWVGTRPTTPPLVTFAQMQAQLRIDTTDDQQYITDLVDACSEHAESALDMSLLTRTIVATYYGDEDPVVNWCGYVNKNKLFLPRGPVQSITSIVDTNGQNITDFEQATYGKADFVKVYGSYVAPLTITYVAGWGDAAADVPSDICMAIRTHVAGLYRNREAVSDKAQLTVPWSLEAFYARKRITAPVG